MRIKQIMRLPPDNMSWIIQIRNISARKDLDHQVEIGDLSHVLHVTNARFRAFWQRRSEKPSHLAHIIDSHIIILIFQGRSILDLV